MGHLIRLQDLLKATKSRIMAAGDVIESTLNMAINVIPKDTDIMRLQETLMRGLIEIEERARLAQPGERRTRPHTLAYSNLGAE